MVLDIRIVITFEKEGKVLLRCFQHSIFDVYKVYMDMFILWEFIKFYIYDCFSFFFLY